MSLYAQAVQTGMSSLQLAFTGDNAKTKVAYNEAYKTAQHKSNIMKAKQQAQFNIGAIEQDRVTTNTAIQMSQDQAEAHATVAAAVAGVGGGSVDDVIYDTERNEALALRSSNRQAEQQKESQLAQIGNQTSSLLAIEEPETSYVGELFKSFSAFELEDIRIGEALANRGT